MGHLHAEPVLPQGEAIACQALPRLGPAHTKRLRKLWSYGRPVHVGQLEGVDLCPQVLLNVRLQPGQDWTKNQKLADLQKQITEDFAGQGRVLIRASGTEPLLRVMVEAFDAARASHYAEQLAEVARQS